MTKERQAVLVKKEESNAEVEEKTYGMSGAKTRSLGETEDRQRSEQQAGEGRICRV